MLIRSRKYKEVNFIIPYLKEKYDYISIAFGAFDWLIIVMKLLGKRTVRVWTGTDVLKVKKFWDYRIRAKILALFSENITDTPWFVAELDKYGIKVKDIGISTIGKNQKN